MRKRSQEIHFPGSPSLTFMTCPAHGVNMGSFEGSHGTLSMCGGFESDDKGKKKNGLYSYHLY